jgi:putative lipoic acid-binding regulatory protein
MTIRRCLLASTAIGILLTAVAAQAQWVMVARAVSGQVQHMTNKSSSGAGYDVATVVLMANADKVYQTALADLQTHPDVKITDKDAKKREIKFSKGDQIASMQATPLGDKLTQLVVASNLVGVPDATSTVVDGVMKVCKQMNVVCTLSNQ